MARRQLLALAFTPAAIVHGLKSGLLHRTEWRAVYAVGRPGLTKHGRLMAAVLWAGPGAMLSHGTAGELWRIWKPRNRVIHLSLPSSRRRERKQGVTVHRRADLLMDHEYGIPITTPLRTIIDLAAGSTRHQAERLIDQADARQLIRADALREQLEHQSGPGVAVHVNGWRVDFYFRELDMVVEANSMRYHRTQHQQRKDSLRAQAHAAAGTVAVPFLHFQIAYEQDYVVRTLVSASAARTAGAGSSR